MSITVFGQPPAELAGHPPERLVGLVSPRPTRRVRHEVRDGMAVIAFSAAASSALALALTVLTAWVD